MARKKKVRKSKTVKTIKHAEAGRVNIPTAEYQTVMSDGDKTPIQVAYERRNRDLDPQLVWRGKDQQDWSGLVVQAPHVYIQEKVHPKVLIDDLVSRTEKGQEKESEQTDLFADFNGLPDVSGHSKPFFPTPARLSNLPLNSTRSRSCPKPPARAALPISGAS